MSKINEQDKNTSNDSIVLTDKFTRDSFYSFLWLLAFRLSSIIGSIIIAFYLTSEYYGIYSIINSWGFFLAAICTFGLPDIITKIITENRLKDPNKNRNFILTTNIMIFVIIGIVVIVTIFTGRIFAQEIYQTSIIEILIYLVLIKIIFTTIFTINQNVLRGFKEYKVIAIYLIIGYTCKVPFLLIFLNFFGIYGIFYTEIIVNFMIFLLIISKTQNIMKNLEKGKFRLEFRELNVLLRQSLPLFIITLMNLLLNWLSLTIFSVYTSFNDVSYFQISFNVMNLILLISFSLNAALLPDIIEKKENDHDNFRVTIEKLIKLNALLTTLSIIFVVLFFPIIINLFYPKYYDILTFKSAIILAPYIFFNSYILISNQILISLEKTWIMFVFTLAYFTLFVPILSIFILFYQNLGLSLTFLILHSIFFPIYLVYLMKNEIKEYKTPIVLGIVNFGLLFILNFSLLEYIFYNFLIWSIFAFIIFISSFVIISIIIKKDENCKMYVKNMIKFIGGIINKK
ncbi:MAG: oligosaccharide flippase family protein [Candidatus Helarchaeota archaeon]